MKKFIYCALMFFFALTLLSGCQFGDVMDKMQGSSDLEEAKWDLTNWDECKWQ